MTIDCTLITIESGWGEAHTRLAKKHGMAEYEAGALADPFWGEDHSFGLSDGVSRLLQSLAMFAGKGRPKLGL